MSLSEHETYSLQDTLRWKAFKRDLKDRGMNGVMLVVSDDHTCLGLAKRAIIGDAPWQKVFTPCSMPQIV